MRTRLLISTVGIATLVALLLGIPMAALLDRFAYETARSQAEHQAVSIGLVLEPVLAEADGGSVELLSREPTAFRVRVPATSVAASP